MCYFRTYAIFEYKILVDQVLQLSNNINTLKFLYFLLNPSCNGLNWMVSNKKNIL